MARKPRDTAEFQLLRDRYWEQYAAPEDMKEFWMVKVYGETVFDNESLKDLAGFAKRAARYFEKLAKWAEKKRPGRERSE